MSPSVAPVRRSGSIARHNARSRSVAAASRAKGAIHLVKVSVETALGLRPKVDVFGTDYPTPDGTCIRDYIHVSDLVSAHSDAPAYLRRGGVSAAQLRLRPGFFRARGDRGGKRVSGVDFKITFADRRAGDPARIVAASDRVRSLLKWQSHFDDLQTIVSHALAWERKLLTRAD